MRAAGVGGGRATVEFRRSRSERRRRRAAKERNAAKAGEEGGRGEGGGVMVGREAEIKMSEGERR